MVDIMKEIEYDYLKRYLKSGEENVLEFKSGYVWLTYNLSPAFNYVFYNPTFDTIFSIFSKLPCFQNKHSTMQYTMIYYQNIKRRFHRQELKQIFGEKINMTLKELCERLLREENINFKYEVYEFYRYRWNGKKYLCFSKAYNTRQELYEEFINYKS